MSQNTTESQEHHSPTTSSSSMNSRMLLGKMQLLAGYQTRLLEITLGYQNDCKDSSRYPELRESMLFARHNDLLLKSLLETSRLISQLESLYGFLLATTLEQSSTNTEPSNS